MSWFLFVFIGCGDNFLRFKFMVFIKNIDSGRKCYLDIRKQFLFIGVFIFFGIQFQCQVFQVLVSYRFLFREFREWLGLQKDFIIVIWGFNEGFLRIQYLFLQNFKNLYLFSQEKRGLWNLYFWVFNMFYSEVGIIYIIREVIVLGGYIEQQKSKRRIQVFLLYLFIDQ